MTIRNDVSELSQSFTQSAVLEVSRVECGYKNALLSAQWVEQTRLSLSAIPGGDHLRTGYGYL